MRTFDYSAFKAQFRASAQARGIDPARGATSYQVANLKADLRKREQLAAPDYGWATAKGRNIFSDAEAVPMRTIKVGRDDLQKHQEAWGAATTGEKSRTRAIWTVGAGLPERQLIPS